MKNWRTEITVVEDAMVQVGTINSKSWSPIGPSLGPVRGPHEDLVTTVVPLEPKAVSRGFGREGNVKLRRVRLCVGVPPK